MKEFFSKNSGIFAIVFLILSSVFATGMAMQATDDTNPVNLLLEAVASVASDGSRAVDFAVEILVYEANQCTTAGEIRDKVDMWESQGWGVQLSAMKHVANSNESIEHLKEMIAYPAVTQAFLARILTF